MLRRDKASRTRHRQRQQHNVDEAPSRLCDGLYPSPRGLSQCLNCRGDPSQLFSQFPNTLSNYVQGVSCILYAYDLHHNFVRSLTVEKFNPQLIFTIQTLVLAPCS